MRLFLVLVSFFWLTQTAFAEGVLMDVLPKDNSVVALDKFDNKIRLAFSGNVSERSSSLVVVDSTGTRVDKQDVQLTIGDRSILTATTIDLAAGRYAIRYRVVTEDGLVVSGICRFELKNKEVQP
ncbi:MAG: copper resistance protein CopC [Methylococcales bacterium]|nr:copper resistance protein CopC [Methylococcales bacterium]